MLQGIRDRMHGIFTGVMLAFFIVPFVFWGVEGFDTGSTNNVADVNDEEIGIAEFQRAYGNERERHARERKPGDPDLDEGVFRKEVLERLVRRAVVTQTAASMGLSIADGHLAQTIREIPGFQRDGTFDNAVYEDRLRLQGYTTRGFEEQLRRDLTVRQLETGVQASAFLTESELAALYRLQAQKRRVAWFMIPAASREEPVDEAALAAWYEAHAAEFREPERVNVDYVELRADALAPKDPPTEEELRSLYETQRDSLVAEEQRRARHILVTVDADADAAKVAEARKTIDAAVDRIRRGESFAKVANEVSQDPGSAPNGGDLGWFARGVMVKEFEDAAFALETGKLSDPVRSPFGFHLIEVTELRAEGVPPFEQIREELAVRFRTEAGQKRFYELAERLSNLAYEHPDSLDAITRELGLNVTRTRHFPREGIPEAGAIEGEARFIAAAFDEETLKGRNSDAVELGPERVVVLRGVEHREASQPELAAVRERVTAAWRAERARERAQTAATEAVAALGRGDDFDAVAKRAGQGGVKGPVEIRRGADTVPAAVRQSAFRIARPSGDKAGFGTARFDNGDMAVVRVDRVIDGDLKDREAADFLKSRATLEQMMGRQDFEGFVDGLRARAVVETYPDRL